MENALTEEKRGKVMDPVPTSLLSETLRGITVLDLSRNLAGPYCTMLLGDLGADVIKVESPGAGDDTRNWRPPDWNGQSATFLACNRNKRSITIDLDTEAGQKLVRLLASRADVVVSSFRPGSLAKRGLDYDSLRQDNEGLVFCSITAYGPKGPKKDAPGYDPVLQAESGLMSMTGHPDLPPARVGVGVIDLGTGMWAAVGIQAALRNRVESGVGALVEVSLYETAAWWLSYHVEGYLATGETPQRQGTGTPFVAPYEVFETGDGGLMVTAGNDHLFVSLCRVLDLPGLPEDPTYAHNADRVANRAALHDMLEERFTRKTASEWEVLLSAETIPCSRIRSVADLVNDPQLDALDMLAGIPHPDIPDLRVVDIPLTLNGERATHRLPPPRLGEQTTAILEELGVPLEEIESLVRERVVSR
jgi:crotonobetainyl-CoA:carnitine CoA-transferase CaiB-like acyl-CoA transferase